MFAIGKSEHWLLELAALLRDWTVSRWIHVPIWEPGRVAKQTPVPLVYFVCTRVPGNTPQYVRAASAPATTSLRQVNPRDVPRTGAPKWDTDSLKVKLYSLQEQ